MKHLFVMDPIERLNLKGDSSYALMIAASERGWEVAWCTPDDLRVLEGVPSARCQRVQASRDLSQPFIREAWGSSQLSEFQCIWMRKDPPFDMEYVFATYILDLVPDSTLVINDPRSIKLANEKMFALQWPDLCPPTLVSRDVESILAFAEEHPSVVLKPWDGNGGRGILVSQAGDKNLRSMAEILTSEGRVCCLTQRYLPEIQEGDRRIILIRGEPRGWFARVPGERDHRGNMHVGAQVQSFELRERDVEICHRLAPRLKQMGLLFVGIDIIGDYLTEINVTSPTGLWEVEALQGRKLADELLDAALLEQQGISQDDQ